MQARVPLIVLTADRPPELREVGAGQTIDQVKLYGDAVKWFFEVDLHDGSAESLRWVRHPGLPGLLDSAERPPGAGAPQLPAPRAAGASIEPLPDGRHRSRRRAPVCRVRPPPARHAAGRGQHPFGRVVIVAGREERDR